MTCWWQGAGVAAGVGEPPMAQASLPGSPVAPLPLSPPTKKKIAVSLLNMFCSAAKTILSEVLSMGLLTSLFAHFNENKSQN